MKYKLYFFAFFIAIIWGGAAFGACIPLAAGETTCDDRGGYPYLCGTQCCDAPQCTTGSGFGRDPSCSTLSSTGNDTSITNHSAPTGYGTAIAKTYSTSCTCPTLSGYTDINTQLSTTRCITSFSYTSCKPGYYLFNNYCMACPNGGTSDDGNTAGMTSCYLPSNQTVTDASGTYIWQNNCNYQTSNDSMELPGGSDSGDQNQGVTGGGNNVAPQP